MTTTTTQFGRDYFENGPATGASLYEGYQWLPERTLQYVHRWARWVKAFGTESVLDFGCAKGFYVRALRILDFQAFGYDTSEYALSAAPSDVAEFLFSEYPHNQGFRYCHAKDVLEHVSYEDIHAIAALLKTNCVELSVVVPLGEDGAYYIPEMEKDPTHIIREPLGWWVEMFRESGWNCCIEAKENLPGLKDHWGHYPSGHGFIRMEV